MSQGLDQHAICKSSCKERDNVMFFPYESVYEKPQNNCEGLIDEIINYKPDNV